MVQINELLGNKAVLVVLHHLAARPMAERHFSALQKETKLAKATLAKVLSRLLQHKLISVKPLGRMRLYRIERNHMLVKQYKIMETLNQLLPLRTLQEAFDCRILLFGSAARGEDTEKSDIDLLLIADGAHPKLITAIERAIPGTRKLAVHAFTPQDWAQMARKDAAFYERVEKDSIAID